MCEMKRSENDLNNLQSHQQSRRMSWFGHVTKLSPTIYGRPERARGHLHPIWIFFI